MIAGRGDWPCRRGCDRCCRNLAAIPQLTRAEWERLRGRIRELPAAVHARILELTDLRPVVCPLLDSDSGACLVYEQRPIACRAYGFYRERESGLYCPEIEAAVERGEFDGVIWGNFESVRPREEATSLLTWYQQETQCPQP